MVSKEDFERIDEEYAKRKLKAADEAFGAPRIYVRADVLTHKNPLPIRQNRMNIPRTLSGYAITLNKEQSEELQRLLAEMQPEIAYKRFADIILPSTLTPKPEDNWLYGQFYKDMVKEKQRDKILFKFGEFVGRLSKEENVSYNDIVGVLLEFIDENIKKK